MALRARKSRRDLLLANKATIEFLALGTPEAGDPFLTKIPEPPKKRTRKATSTGESAVNGEIRDWAEARQDLVLWRNNRGEVTFPNGGRLRYGVGPNGAADWLGYTVVNITPEMVGQRLAVFTAIEAKRPDASANTTQEQFLQSVRSDGGFSGVARSAAEADKVLEHALDLLALPI